MKIINNAGTHFLKINKQGKLKARYDTVKNVNEVINSILDNGSAKMDSHSPTKLLNEGNKDEKS
ncbi:MAG: hypothetical protein ABL880_03545 [Methylotenera sp.]